MPAGRPPPRSRRVENCAGGGVGGGSEKAESLLRVVYLVHVPLRLAQRRIDGGDVPDLFFSRARAIGASMKM